MQRSTVIFGLVTSLILFGAVAVNQVHAQGPRPLAKGVLKVIPEDLNPRDMFSLPRPLPGLNADQYEPLTLPYKSTLKGQSKQIVLFRDNVWQYEFSFIPLRQAKLELPNDAGEIVTKNVWYLLYRVRDTGKTMTFEQVKQNPEFDHIKFDLRRGEVVPASDRKFLPRFTLEGWVSTKNGYQKTIYRDVINPLAVEQIRVREDQNQKLLDTHQMSQAKIPTASKSSDPGVWGVAVWENVQPRIDYVSVYVKGLTNAFRLGDRGGENKLKTLQINFWRPGDDFMEERDFIRFGIPLVDDPVKQVAICERYDLPGPIIRGYHVNKVAKRNVLILETDAQVSLRTFKSALAPELDKGKLPETIAQGMIQAGVKVDNRTPVKTMITGQQWSLTVGDQEYRLGLEPQYWAPDFGKIRFLKRLDYMWIYR